MPIKLSSPKSQTASRTRPVVVLGVVGLWMLACVIQVVFAWGFRGEPKPGWFVVCTWAVYIAPMLFAIVAIATWRRRSLAKR